MYPTFNLKTIRSKNAKIYNKENSAGSSAASSYNSDMLFAYESGPV